MNVTLRQLRAFVALVRTGSFTAASRHLHVTQSALSGLIKELEHGLDVRLVERSTRRVQLSEIGEAFYPWAAKMLEDLDSALRAIADIKELQTGVVRIAAPQLMACTLLPDMVTAFTRQHGAIKVRLVDCAVEEVLDSVQRGEVDFGIGPERALTAETTARPLFDQPFVAIFPPDHPLARLNRVTWKDALAYPMISLRGEYTRRLSADLQAVHPELMLEPVHEVAFMTTAISMVKAGQGITTALPYGLSIIDQGQLEARVLEGPRISRRFHIFARKNRMLSPAAAGFCDFLVQACLKQDWVRLPEAVSR